MTLDQFRAILAKADCRNGSADVGMFLCGVTNLGNARYSYDFDGFITCVMEFHPNGSVSEWQDVDPSEPLPPHQRRHFSCVEAWLAVVIDELAPGRG